MREEVTEQGVGLFEKVRNWLKVMSQAIETTDSKYAVTRQLSLKKSKFQAFKAGPPVNLSKTGSGWAFRTAT